MHSAVTLFDVDNTLLDSDRVVADLMRFMDRELGHARRDDYWQIFETLRTELGYADYLGALQRYRALHPRDSHVLAVSQFLVNYPFANRLFPESLDAIDHARAWGPVAVLTDGDVVFQPRKIERSGLFDAVDHHILIYVHKERELDDVEERFPAELRQLEVSGFVLQELAEQKSLPRESVRALVLREKVEQLVAENGGATRFENH